MTVATTLRATALLAAIALAGCEDPYAQNRPAQTTPKVAAPSDIARPPAPAKPPPTSAPTGPARDSARAAARSFAWRWANWDWHTAGHQQRVLAHMASGDLARQLLANSQSARIDATLARDKPGSRGSVAAVQLNISAARAAGIVVTREQALTDQHPNLGGQHYRVYAVRLAHGRDRWEVSAWTPQP